MNQKKPVKHHKLIKLSIVAVILLVLMVSIVPRAKNIWVLSAKRDQLEQKKYELEQRNEQLNKEKEEVDSPEAIEKIARERLGMIKDGEIIIVPTEK